MIAKESVRARMEDREVGISYTEFSYMILQALDFFHLFEKHDCELQIGGSPVGNLTPFRSLELSCNSFTDNRESVYFCLKFLRASF